MSGSLDGSGGETITVVVGCERVLDVSVSWMSVGWWSGGGAVMNGGSVVKRIKIKKDERKTAI